VTPYLIPPLTVCPPYIPLLSWQRNTWFIPLFQSKKFHHAFFFFNAFIFQNYLSKPLTSFELNFELGISMTEDAGTPLFLQLQMFNLYIISTAVLENVTLTQGKIKGTLIPQ
jgi:hypothetical protein